MKKFLFLTLAVLFIGGLTGCNGGGSKSGSTSSYSAGNTSSPSASSASSSVNSQTAAETVEEPKVLELTEEEINEVIEEFEVEQEKEAQAVVEKKEDPCAAGHTWGDWTVTLNPDCTTEGMQKRVCEVCKASEREPVAALGHSWDKGVVTTEPTTLETGIRHFTCKACDEIRDEVEPVKKIPAKAVNLDALGAEKDLDKYNGSVKGATYVTFGVWPQTIKDSKVEIDEKYINTDITGTHYYLGSDNNWYAKIKENGYSADSQYIYSNKVPVAQKKEAKEKYFLVEPIVWRKVGKMLISEKCLLADVPYYGTTTARTLKGNTVTANNYQYSNIRAFLNGINNQFVTDGGEVDKNTIDWTDKGFLQCAFTKAQQSKIAETKVDNSAESTFEAGSDGKKKTTYDCPDTLDKIFLLSEKEVTSADLGFEAFNVSGSANTRIRKATDYAKATYINCSNISANGSWWWLRSPYYNAQNSAQDVNSNGSANDDRDFVLSKHGGVVPALNLN